MTVWLLHLPACYNAALILVHTSEQVHMSEQDVLPDCSLGV